MKDSLGMWVMFLVPLAAVILILWAIVYFTENYEGVASIGLLILGTGTLVWLGRETVENKSTALIFIGVFSLLGIIFDGAGNSIYNKPIQFLCPPETVLSREVVASEDYEGNTTHNHVFSCYSMAQSQSLKELPLYKTGGIRFVEYLLLATILLGIYGLFAKIIFPRK